MKIVNKIDCQRGRYYEVVFADNVSENNVFGDEDSVGFETKEEAIKECRDILKRGSVVRYVGVYDNSENFNLIGEFSVE